MPSSAWGTARPPGLEQEEVAILVDVPAAEAEMPVDDPDRPLQHQFVEPGLLLGLPPRRVGRGFAVLEMALGKSPVVVRVADEQVAGAAPAPGGRRSRRRSPPAPRAACSSEHRDLEVLPAGAPGCPPAARGIGSTVFVVSKYSVESAASMPSVPLPGLDLEHQRVRVLEHAHQARLFCPRGRQRPTGDPRRPAGDPRSRRGELSTMSWS